MELQIKCIENWKNPPIYSTAFKYLDSKIELNYNYDNDECFVNVNGKEHVYDENETLDKLVDGLSNQMVGLSWESCEVGEELTVDLDYL